MKYKHHSFLDEVPADFAGLSFISGKEIFYRLALWIEERDCAALIPPWQIEMTAQLYHIAFGVAEKEKQNGRENEQSVWASLRKSYVHLAYSVWRFIWQTVAKNSALPCGKSPATEICKLFCEYGKASLVAERRRKTKKSEFDFELSEIPDLQDEE